MGEKNKVESDVQMVLIEEKKEVESIEQLSLVLEGISNIPQSSVILVQTALEEHTTQIVNTIFPAIHFDSTVQLLSVTSNDISKRNLRPSSQGVPSVTIIYNELVEFVQVPGTENMKASTLASLAFLTHHDRQIFVDKFHEIIANDGDNNTLQSLVGVSTVALPPTLSPTPSPSEAPVPTLAPSGHIYESSKNDVVSIVGDSMVEEVSVTSVSDSTAEKPMSVVFISLIICCVAIGIGIIVGIMIIMLQKRP